MPAHQLSIESLIQISMADPATPLSSGLRVFLDVPELQGGNKTISERETTNGGASVHVAIFSPIYAQSKACLNKLVQMVDSADFSLPVFCDVQCCDVGSPGQDNYEVCGRSVRKHEEKHGCHYQIIQKWRFDAATVRNSFSMLRVFTEKLLKKVVQIVLKRQLPKYPNGYGSTVLSTEPVEPKVLGITGNHGVGKTMLAKQKKHPNPVMLS